jgi:TolA-binding protein
MDFALLRQRNFALLLLMALPVVGCSHVRTVPQDNERGSDANTSQIPQPPSELELTRQQVSKLQDRVQDLEVRLSALNDKINLENGAPALDASSAKIQTVVVEAPPAHAKVIPSKKVTAAKPKTAAAPEMAGDDESAASSDAADRFREAKILYDSKRYSDSVLEFAEFVKNEPDHPFAPAAQYYVGMSYLKQNEYKLAEEELSRGLLSYAHSDYVPDTLLALSEVSASLKKPEKVTYYQEKLVNYFPNSPQAKRIGSAPTSANEEARAPVAQATARTMETTEEPTVLAKPAAPEVTTPTVEGGAQ